MRVVARSVGIGLLVAVLAVAGYVLGYGPYRFVPQPLPPDVMASMPAERRAQWQPGVETRIRGGEAAKMVVEDRPIQVALVIGGFFVWVASALLTFAVLRLCGRRAGPNNSSKPTPLRGAA